MKTLGFLALLLGAVFYIAWPAYSGYEIRGALEDRDQVRLSSKIDFPSVRASLRPAVAAKVENELALALKKVGAGGAALNDETKARFMPRIIDGVLNGLVTPEMLIRIHEQGGNLKEAINAIVAERAKRADGLAEILGGFGAGDATGQPGSPTGGGFGKLGEIAEKLGIDPGKALGGLLAKKEEPQADVQALDLTAKKPPRRYGFDNIKHFGLNGPLAVAVGVARDPAAREPDVTAEMSFVDGDWKLTGLVPKL